MFADVVFSDAGIVIIGTLLATVVGALVYVHRLLMSSKDAETTYLKVQIEEGKAREKVFREIATEAVVNLETVANKGRDGLQNHRQIAPVLPRSQSPVTKEQQAIADLATLEARAVAAAKELGLPPRVPNAPEAEHERSVRLKLKDFVVVPIPLKEPVQEEPAQEVAPADDKPSDS